MEKKEMKRVKLDDRLKEMIKAPLPPNVFLRSHAEGLILAMPNSIAVSQLATQPLRRCGHYLVLK